MPSVVTAQTDFSAGEIDVSAKRDGSDLVKASARQMSNWRILNTKKVSNRPGRRALFPQLGGVGGRVEEVLMAPGVTYYLCFDADNALRVRNAAGAVVFTQAGLPFSSGGVDKVVWAVYDKSIYITFANSIPQVLTWDGATTWTIANFAPANSAGGQKRTIFYRMAPKGVTLTPAARTGVISLSSSAAYFTAGMATNNVRIRWHGRQLVIVGFTNAFSVSASVTELLPEMQQLTFTAATAFDEGQILVGATSGARGYIADWLNAAQMNVVLDPGPVFVAGEIVTGPFGTATTSSAGAIVSTSSVVWDEEVMNNYQGWPKSVAVDQNRLIFSNFPALPAGIAWSAVAALTDFYVGAEATEAFFELVPDKAQVFFVAPGTESSEFIFCDNALYYIPISVTNPLRPGSVQFQKLNSDGCAQVQPRAAQEFIAYVNASTNTIMVVLPLGAQTRPYTTRELTDVHSHLFGVIKALAVPTTDGDFPERYMYALNDDGTVVIGKLTTKEGRLDIGSVVGWAPWTSNGASSWLFARDADLLFTSSYGVTISICEVLDADYYLDAAFLVNDPPAAFAASPGQGPLWWWLGATPQTVELMDQSTRMMGTYELDGTGAIVPQGAGGEDLTLASLVAGQPWTATLEPFIPPVQAGQDVEQRMWKRRISNFEVYVQDSSGFVFKRLYSGQSGPLLPADGAVMKERRISTWNQGEDSTLPPTLREQAYRDRPIGRSHDPREAIVKDTPGPLTVLEISTEVTV